MKQKENIVPTSFLWGTATAAHQVEGGIVTSDLWLAEWAEPSLFSEPSGDAVDHYNRFADDMALVSALGLNTYRFSIEWARIEPSEGDFNLDELAHYQRCIDACLLPGIKPMVTFHHFTFPAWVARAGGLHNKKFPD